MPFAHRLPGGRFPWTEGEAATLTQGGFRPRQRFRERAAGGAAAKAFAALLAQSLTVREAAKLLEVHESRVRQRLEGPPISLHGVKAGREWRLPRFQFAGRGTVPGIEGVIGRLDAGLHPLAVERWFKTPNPDLEAEGADRFLSPLQWLSEGRPPGTVAELARGLQAG